MSDKRIGLTITSDALAQLDDTTRRLLAALLRERDAERRRNDDTA